MKESEIHDQKKVKNYLVGGILLLIVIFVFALALVKIRAPQGEGASASQALNNSDKTSEANNAK